MQAEIDLAEPDVAPTVTLTVRQDDLEVILSAAREAQQTYHQGPVGMAPPAMIEAWEQTDAKIGLALIRIAEARRG